MAINIDTHRHISEMPGKRIREDDEDESEDMSPKRQRLNHWTRSNRYTTSLIDQLVDSQEIKIEKETQLKNCQDRLEVHTHDLNKNKTAIDTGEKVLKRVTKDENVADVAADVAAARAQAIPLTRTNLELQEAVRIAQKELTAAALQVTRNLMLVREKRREAEAEQAGTEKQKQNGNRNKTEKRSVGRAVGRAVDWTLDNKYVFLGLAGAGLAGVGIGYYSGMVDTATATATAATVAPVVRRWADVGN